MLLSQACMQLCACVLAFVNSHKASLSVCIGMLMSCTEARCQEPENTTIQYGHDALLFYPVETCRLVDVF